MATSLSSVLYDIDRSGFFKLEESAQGSAGNVGFAYKFDSTSDGSVSSTGLTASSRSSEYQGEGEEEDRLPVGGETKGRDLLRPRAEVEYVITTENTVFIIDWDDTLLATSWLARTKLSLDTPFIPHKEWSHLEALDTAVCSFLRKVMYLYGRILIVTNAQQGWVELSAQKFLPETYDLIFQPSAESSCCSFSSSSSGFQNDATGLAISESRQVSLPSRKKSSIDRPRFSLDFLENNQQRHKRAKIRRVHDTSSRTSLEDEAQVEVEEYEMEVDLSSDFPATQDDHSDSDIGLHRDISLLEAQRAEGGAEVKKVEKAAANQKPSAISVISARFLYEKEFPFDPSAWKLHTFQQVLKNAVSPEFIVMPDEPKKQPKQTPLSLCSSESAESSCSDTVLAGSSSDATEPKPVDNPEAILDDVEFDIENLVEIKGESFEIETDFEETDSFFSFDFRPTSRSEDDVEFDTEFNQGSSFPPTYASSSIHPSNERGDAADNGADSTSARPEVYACNLISIGDCHHDCESLRKVDLPLRDCFKKTIKLIEGPSITRLIKELEELEMHLDKVVRAKTSIDLKVNPSHLR